MFSKFVCFRCYRIHTILNVFSCPIFNTTSINYVVVFFWVVPDLYPHDIIHILQIYTLSFHPPKVLHRKPRNPRNPQGFRGWGLWGFRWDSGPGWSGAGVDGVDGAMDRSSRDGIEES